MKKLILLIALIVTLGCGGIAAKGKSGFTMWQLPMKNPNFGNSFVFRTDKGKIIVFDGGPYQENRYLRGFLAALGNEVEAWFVSHPHDDHVGALTRILQDPQGVKIKRIYYSRFSPELLALESPYDKYALDFYAALDTCSAEVVDLREPGLTGSIDGFNFKILGVTNEEFHTNPYNNSSTIIKVWDDKKSILFLGDAGIECGDKLLNGPYGKELDCDYIQVAHHGQHGCSEKFYKTVKFKACIWCTALWIYNNDQGGGYNTGNLESFDTRRWMDEIGIKEHHINCIHGLFRLD